MSKQWEPGSLFDVFGNEQSRRILVLASDEPVSVDELSEHLDASEPTIYRRIEVLQQYDLLTERTEYDQDGHHYHTYETKLREICFEIEGGGFNVDIALRHDLVDRFSEFWSGLEESAGGDSDA